MATTELTWGTTTAVPGLVINSVDDGLGDNSTVIDCGSPGSIAIGIHAVLKGSAAGNADYVEWYAKWSEDNSAYTADAVAPLVHLSEMQGTTAFDDHFVIQVQMRYLILRAVNQSGAIMASSGNSAEYVLIDVTQT